MHTHTCAYQGERYVSFSGIFAYVLDEYSLSNKDNLDISS